MTDVRAPIQCLHNSLHSPPMSTSYFRLTETPPRTLLSTTTLLSLPIQAPWQFPLRVLPNSLLIQSGHHEDGDENCVPEVADGPFSLQKKDTIHRADSETTRRNWEMHWMGLTEQDHDLSTMYFEWRIKLATLLTEINHTPDMLPVNGR
jgi:hypothetical protein